MKKLVPAVSIIFLWLVSVCILPAAASTIYLDLNDFYPDVLVTIAGNGLQADLEEDPDYGYTQLLNDPFWGDPGITVPAGALELSFDYNFFEETGNDTEFWVHLFDGVSGNSIDNSFVLDASAAGTKAYDLTTLLSPGQTLLGLNFHLDEYEYDSINDIYNVGSTVSISNLRLDIADQPQPTIPEPSTMILLGFGLVALSRVQRKRH